MADEKQGVIVNLQFDYNPEDVKKFVEGMSDVKESVEDISNRLEGFSSTLVGVFGKFKTIIAGAISALGSLNLNRIIKAREVDFRQFEASLSNNPALIRAGKEHVKNLASRFQISDAEATRYLTETIPLFNPDYGKAGALNQSQKLIAAAADIATKHARPVDEVLQLLRDFVSTGSDEFIKMSEIFGGDPLKFSAAREHWLRTKGMSVFRNEERASRAYNLSQIMGYAGRPDVKDQALRRPLIRDIQKQAIDNLAKPLNALADKLTPAFRDLSIEAEKLTRGFAVFAEMILNHPLLKKWLEVAKVPFETVKNLSGMGRDLAKKFNKNAPEFIKRSRGSLGNIISNSVGGGAVGGSLINKTLIEPVIKKTTEILLNKFKAPETPFPRPGGQQKNIKQTIPVSINIHTSTDNPQRHARLVEEAVKKIFRNDLGYVDSGVVA